MDMIKQDMSTVKKLLSLTCSTPIQDYGMAILVIMMDRIKQDVSTVTKGVKFEASGSCARVASDI